MGLRTPRSRKIVFAFLCLSLFFFLVGFGVGVEHEGEMTVIRIPELVAFLLSTVITALLSYILVADEKEIDPVVYRSLQVGSLLSFYAFSISIGKSGVIITRCEFGNWRAHDAFHHCTASIVQFASAVVHIFSLMAAVIDSMRIVPVQAPSSFHFPLTNA